MSIYTMYSNDGRSHPVTKFSAVLNELGSPLAFSREGGFGRRTQDIDVESLILNESRYDLLIKHLHDVLDEGEFEELTGFFDFGKTRDEFKPLLIPPEHIQELLEKIDRDFVDMLIRADEDTNGYKTVKDDIEGARDTLRGGGIYGGYFTEGFWHLSQHIAEYLLKDSELLRRLEKVEKMHEAYIEAISDVGDYVDKAMNSAQSSH
ncbi:hypothetical protein IKE71_01550 [Candidatus Saccharibacteria bacterium]|nr:hypothetical protein [Candidatus Saccharibacteria bacterium]